MPYKSLEIQREYQRRWMANRRAEFFKDKVCCKCGTTENLELDHIDRTQKVTHRIWSWSKEKRDVEIAKCQILCHDCHVEKSIEFDWKKPVHGSVEMYRKYKCRCFPCIARARKRYADDCKHRKARKMNSNAPSAIPQNVQQQGGTIENKSDNMLLFY